MKQKTDYEVLNENELNEVLFSGQSKQVLFEKEVNQSWIVGHVGEIDEAGKFFTLNIGKYPLIIVKNENNEIKALNNSCRHRGSKVCQTQNGQVANLVCPYHQWTYDLNGKLKYAQAMMEEVDCDDYPLKEFATEIDQGIIQVNLGATKKQNRLPKLEQTVPDQCVIIKIKLPLKSTTTAEFFNDFEHLVKQIEHQYLKNNTTNKVVKLAHNGGYYDLQSYKVLAHVQPSENGQDYAFISFMAGYDLLWHNAQQDISTWLENFAYDYQIEYQHELYKQHEPIDYTEQEPQEVLEIIANLDEQPTRLENAIAFENVFSSYKVWDSKEHELFCTSIVQESHNVRTYSFQSEISNWFSYKPGQFITLELPVKKDEPILRTYTLSSSPSRPLSISITIKLNEGSVGTKWIFENVKKGDRLKAHGPAGEFSFFNKATEKYLFISAGSGITPMLSMTRWMFDYGRDMDINFINCVQSPADLLFKRELEGMAKRSKNLSVSWVCEKDTDNIWTGIKGRFNKLILGLVSQDYMERDVYCCGPPPFMKAVRDALYVSGFDMEKYYEESFVTPEKIANPFFQHEFPVEAQDVKVSFVKSAKQLQLAQNETLLMAAKNSHIALPSACGFGVCGTCKVKVTKGQTHMVHSGGISQKEIDQGYVLACCTTPLEDVEIEL